MHLCSQGIHKKTSKYIKQKHTKKVRCIGSVTMANHTFNSEKGQGFSYFLFED